MLKNLLEWARSQTGGLSYKSAKNKLGEIVPEIVKVSKKVVQKKEIQLNSDIDSEIIYADKNMVQTIIRNLVSKAFKFTPKGSQLTLKSEELVGKGQILVSDTGIGIETKKIDNLF